MTYLTKHDCDVLLRALRGVQKDDSPRKQANINRVMKKINDIQYTAPAH